MEISVIIPTYNRKERLSKALQTVLLQKEVRFELIVVDDGSNDGTGEMIQKSFPSVKGPCFARPPARGLSPRAGTAPETSGKPGASSAVKYFFQANQGPSAARNRGIEQSQGEWIAFLDSDDEWMPGKLKAQLDFFQKNPEYLICQTEEIWIRNGRRVNPMKKHKKYAGWIFEKCLPLCIISPSAAMMHRSLFDKVGLFDESLPACEDYDLWLRVAAQFPVGLIETPYLMKYGGHADQRSHEFPAMDRFRIYSLKKILQSGQLTKEQAKAAEKMLEEKSRIYLQGALKRGGKEEILDCFASLAMTAKQSSQTVSLREGPKADEAISEEISQS